MIHFFMTILAVYAVAMVVATLIPDALLMSWP